MGKAIKKPSTSKWRASSMAVIAAFIACHPAMGVFGLAATVPGHADKIGQLSDGTYPIGRAISASLQTIIEGMALGWAAFLFTLPIALLFGLPAHALLVKSGFWKKRHYALAGAFLGTVAYIYFIGSTKGGLGISFASNIDLFLGTFTGLIAAVLFRIFMGNRGNPNGLPATWQNHLFLTPNLPEDMPFKQNVWLCLGSGVLAMLVSLSVRILADLSSNLTILIFSGFGRAAIDLGDVFRNSQLFLHQYSLYANLFSILVFSVLFTGIYVVLKWLNRTGFIAFAFAGLIGGPIIFVASQALSTFLNYGVLVGPVFHSGPIKGAIISAFTCALTAVIFRALLGRMATKQKGRNISAPAS